MAAGIVFVTLLLPWLTFNGVKIPGTGGFTRWGLLSVAGLATVIVISFMGDKTKDYNVQNKKIILAAFAAIALGAIIYLITKNSAIPSYSDGFSDFVMNGWVQRADSSFLKPGFGIWLTIISGLAGLVLNLGIIIISDNKPKT